MIRGSKLLNNVLSAFYFILVRTTKKHLGLTQSSENSAYRSSLTSDFHEPYAEGVASNLRIQIMSHILLRLELYIF